MTAQIEPFKTMSVSALAHKLSAAGRSVIHMEFGQPSTGAPAAAIAEAHRVLDADSMGYWESQPLKARIVRHYADWYGVAIKPAQIILTCGASPALVLALSTCFAPGARVATARPGYVAYRNNLRALHMEPIEIQCGEAEKFQLSAAALAAIEPAPDGVILASPANPTGTIIPHDELAAIAKVCRERGITIVSDEIYHGISYGMKTPSILEVEPDAFVVNSFSKYFSMAGWRLGWLVVPESGIDAGRARMSNLFLTPPSLAQHAGLVAMDCTADLEAYVATYTANRELLLAALPELGLARIAPPDGAFYVYADISEFTDDSMQFCMQLLEDTGVATAPGIDFDPVGGHRFMRISFAVSTELVAEAIARMKPWFAARNRGARS
ncbi:MAG: aminotransferase class I/II-fold pyridoxal phosphate-dependent enzyme [Pseudomonadota bacterium]|nr:aminotransferase class I/II-fold pyridoxal phosphate-dependent enzyme [Pseudomonadota bacterium]